MEEKQIMILDEFASDLKSSLRLSYLLPHLMKRKLLTTSEECRLKNQTRTDHDNNCDFIDYLKTKGSCAFDLFLAALGDETEHLGHVDLYNKMSKRATESVVSMMSLETLSGSSASTQSIDHDQSAVNRVPSANSPPSLATTRAFSSTMIEITLKVIMEKLDKIEKTVKHNQSEIQELRKVCDKLMLVKPEQESESDRPDCRGHSLRPHSISADSSSISDSETIGPVQQLQSCESQVTKEPLALPDHHDNGSLHSIHEERTSNTLSALVFPQNSKSQPQISWPIGLHV